MAGPVFTNNAVGTLAASAASGDTALTLTAGQGNLFPLPGTDEWFAITIVNAANDIEIVYCTARAGDALTVERGQEGTVARALGAGEKVEHRLTAGTLGAIRDRPLDPSQIENGSITGPKLAAGAVTSGKIADGAVGGEQLFQGKFIDNQFLLPGTAAANLGFTPVQQGGGIGQTDGKLRIGWTAQAKLRVQVDAVDIGYLLNLRDDGDPATAGYRGSPHTVINLHYVFGVQDAGRTIVHTSGSARTYRIPDDSVPFQQGSKIEIMNRFGTVTLEAAAGVEILWAPNNVIGSRTLNAPGVCWIEKVSSTLWWVYGYGLA